LSAEFHQLTAGEFAKLIQAIIELVAFKFRIEDYHVQMRGHGNVRINSQSMLLVTESQAFEDDLGGTLADEYRQPIHDTEGAKVERGIGCDAVSLHETECRRKGDQRSSQVRGQETCAQLLFCSAQVS